MFLEFDNGFVCLVLWLIVVLCFWNLIMVLYFYCW